MPEDRDIEMSNGDENSNFKWVEVYAQDLEEPARTGRTKADWNTLRHIIKCRINHNIIKYLTRTPRPRTNPLLSASSIDSFASEHPQQPELIRPSTPGGLILPPWPSKSPRLRNGAAVGVGGMMGTVEGGQPRAMFCGPGEPMVDDDAAIGGKTLSANLNDEEARMAKHRIYKLLDTFEEEPPFTIQRVCELALNPTSSHKSLGKYLRALQKVLLVTSNWDPLPSSPPPPTQSSSSRLYSQSSAVFGSESPHSSTPLFSPIPFLMRSGSLEPDSFRLDEGDPSDSAGVMNPMSLNLDVGPDHSATVRPPNMMMDDPNNHPPNPLILASANSGASVPNGGESADHHREREPFMGRVDEMDSGPLLSSPTIIVSPSNPHALHTNPSAERQYGEGTGESGNMVPHGISERPQAISSTTTLSPMNQEETSSSPEGSPTARKVARLPRTTSMGNLSDRFVKAEVLPSAETAAGSGMQMAAATIDDREEQPSNGTEGGATKMRRVE